MGEVKVFVGNVNFKATKDDLSRFFCDCQAISEVAIILDKHTRSSKGYAFIIFSNEEAAKDAVARMNGQSFQGRPLKVKLADNQENNRSFKNFDVDKGRDCNNLYDQGGYGDMYQRQYGSNYPHPGDYGGYSYGANRGGYNDSYGSGDYYQGYKRNERPTYGNSNGYYYY